MDRYLIERHKPRWKRKPDSRFLGCAGAKCQIPLNSQECEASLLIKCARNEDPLKSNLGPVLRLSNYWNNGCQEMGISPAISCREKEGWGLGTARRGTCLPGFTRQKTLQRDGAVERCRATPWPGLLGLIFKLYPHVGTPKMDLGKLPDLVVSLPNVDTWNKPQGKIFWFS